MNLGDVQKLERFTLGPDEVLLITVPDNTDIGVIRSIHESFCRALPDGARVVVKSDRIDVAVINAELALGRSATLDESLADFRKAF